MTLHWYGREIEYQITQACEAGLNRGARLLQIDARERAPHETGALKASIKVEPATFTSLVAAVYSESPYAVRQHEGIHFNRTSGEAKYLENAANAFREEFARQMAQAMRGVAS